VREDWEDKLGEDLGKIHKHGHACDEVVFLTNGSPTAGEKDKKKKEVKEQHGWGLEFYDLERISTLIDGRHRELRALHPQIFIISSRLVGIEPTGGELDRKGYAAYLQASYAEWRERYTPLLAEYREVESFVTPAGSDELVGSEIPVARVHEHAGVAVLLGESGAGKTTALWKIIVEACATRGWTRLSPGRRAR
jgi:flagellar biosynthesis GTPase FlhF